MQLLLSIVLATSVALGLLGVVAITAAAVCATVLDNRGSGRIDTVGGADRVARCR